MKRKQFFRELDQIHSITKWNDLVRNFCSEEYINCPRCKEAGQCCDKCRLMLNTLATKGCEIILTDINECVQSHFSVDRIPF